MQTFLPLFGISHERIDYFIDPKLLVRREVFDLFREAIGFHIIGFFDNVAKDLVGRAIQFVQDIDQDLQFDIINTPLECGQVVGTDPDLLSQLLLRHASFLSDLLDPFPYISFDHSAPPCNRF